MITCPSCGKQNQDYYKFCLGCGTKLPRARMNSDLDETAPQGMPKAAPVVEGAQMVDILEHINMPVPAARAAAIPPARRRTLHGESFDTARHAAAVHLWRASCTAATGFCKPLPIVGLPCARGSNNFRTLN